MSSGSVFASQRGVEALVELVLGQAPGREVVAERVRGLLTLLIGYAETFGHLSAI